MSHALVVGKFYPPHEGHHKLIETAMAECDRVTVAACHSSVENIPIEDRIAWIYDAHGGRTSRFEIVPVKDDTPVEYTDETWGYFLDALMKALDDREDGWGKSYPSVVYSGESYAPEFAERLNRRYDEKVFRAQYPDPVRYVMLSRTNPSFSATEFRKDPAENWNFLRGATRAGLCKRVVICGAESSGTTTLAKALADYYQTTAVPEYGRHFDWAVGPHHEWTHDDFTHIAREQKRWEDNLARQSQNGLLICDTDEYATAMFSEVYLGHRTPGILERAEATPADLYIVTDHFGVEFEDDGTRSNPDKRRWMTKWFLDNLAPTRRFASGSHHDRMALAISAIDTLLTQGWDIADPIEYRAKETA